MAVEYISNAYDRISGFADQFSAAGLGSVSLSQTFFSGLEALRELGESFTGWSGPKLDAFKLMNVLSVIVAPIVMIQDLSAFLKACKIGDRIGQIVKGTDTMRQAVRILSTISSVATTALAFFAESPAARLTTKVFGGISMGLASVLNILLQIKRLVTTGETGFFYWELWKCESRDDRIEFVRNALIVDLDKVKAEALSAPEKDYQLKDMTKEVAHLKHLNDIAKRDNLDLTGLSAIERRSVLELYDLKKEKQVAWVKRSIGSDGVKAALKGDYKEMRKQMHWTYAKKAVSIALIVASLALTVLIFTGMLPAAVVFITPIISEFDTIWTLYRNTVDYLKDVKKDPKPGDIALIAVAAIAVAAVFASALFLHMGAIPLMIVIACAVLSIALVAYCYKRVRKNAEHKIDYSRVFNASGVGEGLGGEYDSGLFSRSVEVLGRNAA